MTRSASRPGHKTANGSVRIIGGDLRSRRIPVNSARQLRPTPDRVRETLFNWISTGLQNAHCLDLFSGSGVLGFEALSRGASTVTMVENSGPIYRQLIDNASLLDMGSRVQIIRQNAFKYLQRTDQSFDFIFIDPPFDDHAVEPTLTAIYENDLLNPGGRVYVEQRAQSAIDNFTGWRMLRSGRAGDVDFRLLETDRP